jgi:hypothetical protein
MPEKEICSPVSRPGSKVGSGQPMSPGARSSPSRSAGPQIDSIPPQPTHGGGGVRSHAEEPPLPAATTTVVGPED